jgi:hypothetical protein
MSASVSRARMISAWFAVFSLTTVVSVIFGATATPATWALLLLIGLMPVAIVMAVWRDGPPQTVAGMLYAVEPEKR